MARTRQNKAKEEQVNKSATAVGRQRRQRSFLGSVDSGAEQKRVEANKAAAVKLCAAQVPELIDKVAAAQEEIALLQNQIAEDSANIEKLMINADETYMIGNNYSLTAAIQESFGNSKTDYDNKKLFDRLSVDEFLECVKPVGKKVSDYLTGKQIQEVATVTEGKSKGMVCVIKPAKKNK